MSIQSVNTKRHVVMLKMCLAFTVKVYTLRSGLALKGRGGNIGLANIGSTKPVPMPMLRSYLFSSVQACIYLYPQPVGQLVAKRVIEECCKQPHVGPIGTDLHKL